MIMYYRPVGTPHRYRCTKSNGEQAKRGLVFILTFSLHTFSVDSSNVENQCFSNVFSTQTGRYVNVAPSRKHTKLNYS